ncbi:MAG: AAA family ATPase, partial [Bacteroidia bacterium]
MKNKPYLCVKFNLENMQILSLTLENFRCFERLELKLSPQFNVLIGENGSGKSAVMDALAKAIGNAFPTNAVGGLTPSLPVPQKEDKDIRYLFSDKGKETILADKVKVGYILSDGQSHTFDYKEAHSWNQTLLAKTKTLLLAAKAGENVNLPIFAYYPANRNWQTKNAANAKDYERGSRLEGYKDWFQPNVSTDFVISWVKNRESADLQQNKRNGNGGKAFEMSLLRQVAQNCIPNCEEVYYDFDETQLMLKIKGEAKEEDNSKPSEEVKGKEKCESKEEDNAESKEENSGKVEGKTLPFNLLSSGFQNMFAIVMDLVFRCARLNPHLRENACKESEGIVLIDELDLHLHPNWQKRIVGDLQKSFPKLQFIVTTHSPFIIQDVPKSQIQVLNQQKAEMPKFEPNLLTPDSIFTMIQGVEDIETQERTTKIEELASLDILMLALKKEGKESSPEMQQYWNKFREIAQELNWETIFINTNDTS